MDRRGRETSEGVASGDKGYLVVELMREGRDRRLDRNGGNESKQREDGRVLVLSIGGGGIVRIENYLQSVMDRMFDSRESANSSTVKGCI